MIFNFLLGWKCLPGGQSAIMNLVILEISNFSFLKQNQQIIFSFIMFLNFIESHTLTAFFHRLPCILSFMSNTCWFTSQKPVLGKFSNWQHFSLYSCIRSLCNNNGVVMRNLMPMLLVNHDDSMA
jgi:hypothetical protein